MSEKITPSTLERRSFISRISTGVAAFAGVMAGSAATGFAPKAVGASFQPELHEKDDWMDKIPGKHRVVFDTTTPDVLGDALAFANNYFRANKSDYGLQNNDLAVIVIMRARATSFAYATRCGRSTEPTCRSGQCLRTRKRMKHHRSTCST